MVDPAKVDPSRVRFGATVAVEGTDGNRRTFQIVGVDEAVTDPEKVAFTAPIARSVIGRAVGDAVELTTPRGTEPLVVRSIAYR